MLLADVGQLVEEQHTVIDGAEPSRNDGTGSGIGGPWSGDELEPPTCSYRSSDSGVRGCDNLRGHNRRSGALSSARLERLPYKEKAGGSNPSAPTQ